MRYFEPRFQIATLSGSQGRLKSKIGGVPWGLPKELWPTCCGFPQKLLAQLCHEPPMLDLGDEGAVLHLFQCQECGGIGFDGRGLASFIVNQSALSDGLMEVDGYDHVGDLGPVLIGEAWIEGWKERDDGIPESRLGDFYDWNSLMKLHDEFPKIDWFESRQGTKFGGSPRWTGNGPMGFPPRPFEFLFQLDTYLFVEGPPPNPDDVGCTVTTYSTGSDQTDAHPRAGRERTNAPWFVMHERGTPYYYFQVANLGSDGTAYVFIDRSRRPHGVKWFWNR